MQTCRSVFFFAAIFLAFPAMAQDEDQEFEEEFALLEESELVFTASRHEQAVYESPATVTVIAREEIENTHCTDVTCLLRQVPELEVRQMNSFHHSVGARALSDEMNDKVLLLIDGREDNMEAIGMPLWQELGLHLDDIQRIEVVRGPASALYGANAHSLVVSITTRRPEKNRSGGFLGGGERGRFSAGGFLHRLAGPWKFGFRAGHDSETEERLPDRHCTWLGAQLGLDWMLGSTAFDASYARAGGELPVAFAPTEIRDVNVIRASLTHTKDWLSIRLWYQLGEFEAFYNMPITYKGIRLGSFADWATWRNHAADIEAQATYSLFSGNLLVAGGNWRWLGMYVEHNQPNWVAQQRLGLFVHDEQKLRDFLLVAGVRLDYNTITPFTVSPRATVVWSYSEGQSLRAGFGRAFRKPSFMNTSLHLGNVKTEPGFEGLAGFISRSLGNEDLHNETVNSFEVGWRVRFFERRLQLEADAFYNMYRDAIIFEYRIVEDNFGLPNFAQSWFRFENRGANIDSVGGSISAVYQWEDVLRLGANYTYRYSRFLTDVKETAFYGKGDRLPYEPAHLFNLHADWRWRGLRLGLSLHVRSSFDERWTKKGELFGEECLVHEPARALWGGYASWRFGGEENWLEAGVRALNFTGERWRDVTGIERFDDVPLGGTERERIVFAFLRFGL